MTYKIKLDREEDGRWIASVPGFRGVIVYGATRKEAISNVEALLLRVLTDRIDDGHSLPKSIQVEVLRALATGEARKPAGYLEQFYALVGL